MIIEEFLNDNFSKHYSNNRIYILQKETGNIYAEAINVLPCLYTYEEINQLIYNNENLINKEGDE